MAWTKLVMMAFTALMAIIAQAHGTNHGVFVDGGYSPGDNITAMDRLIDERLQDASDAMGQRDPNSQRTTVDKKDSLAAVLSRINCACGDTVNVFMMGHGTENRFVFTKEKEKLKAQDLASWLEGTATECCCKINVVIFSCHSGSFQDELFAAEHIESVYTSCGVKQKCRSDQVWVDTVLVDHGDWMGGFIEDYRQAPPDSSHAAALQEGLRSAAEKTPPEFWSRETPTGWRRGDFPVLAHVESLPSRTRVKISYYDPPFMRSQTKVLDARNVKLPNRLRHCDWVSFTGRFTHPGENPLPVSDLSRTECPTEEVLAHVRHRKRLSRNPYLLVHTVRPRWLNCNKQRVSLENRDQIPTDLRKCQWIQQDMTIADPKDTMRTADPINRVTPRFSAKVHYGNGNINRRLGTVTVHALSPPWLKCKNYTIVLPPGERGALENLKRCNNYTVDLDFNPDGTVSGRNFRGFKREEGSFEPVSDAAFHTPNPIVFQLEPLDDEGLSREIFPSIAVTNVGSEPISFEVRAIGGSAEQSEILEVMLREGIGETEIAWQGTASDSAVAGETVEVAFAPWDVPPEGGPYWVGFALDAEEDENLLSNFTSAVFEFPPALQEETKK